MCYKHYFLTPILKPKWIILQLELRVKVKKKGRNIFESLICEDLSDNVMILIFHMIILAPILFSSSSESDASLSTSASHELNRSLTSNQINLWGNWQNQMRMHLIMFIIFITSCFLFTYNDMFFYFA